MPSENTYNSWIKQFPIGSVYRFDLQRIGCTTEQIDALSDMDMLAIANKMQAAFTVAPMAIALRSQGVPIRIVYLGHRYGSAIVVHKNGGVKTFSDMKGRIIAIPSRFSDERLLVFKALKKYNMSAGELKMVEMAPPFAAAPTICTPLSLNSFCRRSRY